jgi:hypothetical protein
MSWNNKEDISLNIYPSHVYTVRLVTVTLWSITFYRLWKQMYEVLITIYKQDISVLLQH